MKFTEEEIQRIERLVRRSDTPFAGLAKIENAILDKCDLIRETSDFADGCPFAKTSS